MRRPTLMIASLFCCFAACAGGPDPDSQDDDSAVDVGNADAGVDARAPDASGSDAGRQDSADMGAELDCTACATPGCWEECGQPELSGPDVVASCEGHASVEGPFEMLVRLDPGELGNFINFAGSCAALADASDHTFSFVPAESGEFEVRVRRLGGEGGFDLVTGVAAGSPANVCDHYSDAVCSELETDGSRLARRTVVAGTEYFVTVEFTEADDFYISGKYYEPPREPGEACDTDSQCLGVAGCESGVCACGDGAVESIAAGPDGDVVTSCACEEGFVPDGSGTACVQNPCEPDPCPEGERCSVEQGAAVCTPSLARVGERCNDDTNPCEPGLSCQFIPCPYATGGRMCVTPCDTATQCNEGNIACPKRNATQQPTCEETSSSSPAYCTWDG